MTAPGDTDRQPVVLFYVQHLLGIGHVFRATRVGKALAKAGARVHMVWGGTRLPSIDTSGLEMHYLEPVRVADTNFQDLVEADGTPVTDTFRERRRDALLALFERLRPDIVITEAYPFGRRQMRFELEPLMRAARAADWHPFTVASIRDIMQEGRAEKRVRESLDAAKAWFDLVIVHGDPQLIRIEETLQGATEILDRIRYGGLVTPAPPDMSVPSSVTASVVVSTGGGAFGHTLTQAALGAMKRSTKFPDDWLLITGSERPEADFETLRGSAPEGMRVERFVPDLARVLADASVSVSMAGYNTVGDLLRVRKPAVLVAHTGGRESEQLRRATAMAERGLAVMLTDAELTPENLADAVDRASKLPPARVEFDLDGAEHAAEIILAEWGDR